MQGLTRESSRGGLTPYELKRSIDAAGFEIARLCSHKRVGMSHEATSASLRWLAI